MHNQKWWWLGTIGIFILLLYLLSPILTPFFIACLLAYLGDPLVNRMVSVKIPRTVAVIIVFGMILLIILLLVLLLIPLLEKQIVILIGKIPQLITWVQMDVVPWISEKTGIKEVFDFPTIQTVIQQHWQQAGNIASTVLKTISYSGYSLFVFLLNLVLIPVVTFYLLRDWDRVVIGLQGLIPRSIEPIVVKLVGDCDEVIGAFFRGQLLVMLSLAVFYSVALWLVGIQLALLIGIIVGLVSIVPYLGFIVGIVLTTIATVMQFYDWRHLGYVAIVFAIGNVLENYVLSPNLVGDRIGLHPVAVIFAILAGGQLFGFLGILLALPVAAIIMVLIRYLRDQYLQSGAYRKKHAR